MKARKVLPKASITSEQRVKEVELEVEAMEKALEQKKIELMTIKWIGCEGCRYLNINPVKGSSCGGNAKCSRRPDLPDLFEVYDIDKEEEDNDYDDDDIGNN